MDMEATHKLPWKILRQYQANPQQKSNQTRQ